MAALRCALRTCMTLVHHDRGSEFAVLAAGDGFAELQIHNDSTYKIENEKIIWYGEGWELSHSA